MEIYEAESDTSLVSNHGMADGAEKSREFLKEFAVQTHSFAFLQVSSNFVTCGGVDSGLDF